MDFFKTTWQGELARKLSSNSATVYEAPVNINSIKDAALRAAMVATVVKIIESDQPLPNVGLLSRLSMQTPAKT